MSAIVMLEGDGQTGEMMEMPGIGLENGHNKYPFSLIVHSAAIVPAWFCQARRSWKITVNNR